MDPRWDVDGFGAWLAGCPCVSVGFLRETKLEGRHPCRHHVPEGKWVRQLPPGAGIDGVQLFTVLSSAFGLPRSPDLAASELDLLLEVLKSAEQGDLVW